LYELHKVEPCVRPGFENCSEFLRCYTEAFECYAILKLKSA